MNRLVTVLCMAVLFVSGTTNTYAEEPAVPESDTESHGPVNPYRASGIPINADQAQAMASKVRDSQVMQGELAKSWSAIKVTETKQRIFQNEKEWVVMFTNPAEPNPVQKTLYIFLDLYGDVVDVNFSGK